MALVQTKGDADYSIKPEAVTPALDTSEWPLLLRNYSKCKKYLCHLYRNFN
jgi:H/ACA ribonucleoprotein complex subunit 4